MTPSSSSVRSSASHASLKAVQSATARSLAAGTVETRKCRVAVFVRLLNMLGKCVLREHDSGEEAFAFCHPVLVWLEMLGGGLFLEQTSIGDGHPNR